MTPKEDLFAIMDEIPAAYDVVRSAILEGRIDPRWSNVAHWSRRGSIKAHIAGHMKCRSQELSGAAKLQNNRSSPIEVYMRDTDLGQKPDTSPVLKQVLEWLDEWKNGVSECDFEVAEEVQEADF